jgi:hypothetical protein
MVELPERAREKLAQLVDTEDEFRTLSHAASKRLTDLLDAFANNPTGDNAADIEFEIGRQRSIQAQHQASHLTAATIATAVRTFLAGLPRHMTIESARKMSVKLNGKESTIDAVNRIRDHIARMSGERLDTLQASMTVEDIKETIRSHVKRLASKGKPRLRATHDVFDMSFGDPNAFTHDVDFPSILAWFDEDKFVERLWAEVDILPTPKLALPLKEKTERLDALAKQLRALEFEEEELITLAASQGRTIQRRPAADPCAILGIVIKDPNSKAQAA